MKLGEIFRLALNKSELPIHRQPQLVTALPEKNHLGESGRELVFKLLTDGRTLKLLNLAITHPLLARRFDPAKLQALQTVTSIEIGISVLPSWLIEVIPLISRDIVRGDFRTAYEKLLEEASKSSTGIGAEMAARILVFLLIRYDRVEDNEVKVRALPP